jgi:hypothetical protein
MPYSGGDGLTGGVGRTAPGHDSQACQRRSVYSSLTRAPASVRALSAPVGGAGTGAASPRRPRARRDLTRAGDRPSSEEGPHPRGRPALERGGGLLVWCRAPRAKWSSDRGWLGRQFWWAAGATGAVGPSAGPSFFLKRVLGLFAFCYLRKSGFSLVV